MRHDPSSEWDIRDGRGGRAGLAIGPLATRLCVAERQDGLCAAALFRADRPEYAGRSDALSWAARFFLILDRSGGLRAMTRPRGQLAIPERARLPTHRLRRDAHAKLFERPLAEIDKPPVHDAVDGRDRAVVDRLGERRSPRIVEPRLLAWRLAVDQDRRPLRVELQNPAAHDLQRHAADPGRLDPFGAIVNRRKRQKPPRVPAILRPLRLTTKLVRIKIRPYFLGMANSESFAALNEIQANLGIPPTVMFSASVVNVPLTDAVANVNIIQRRD
jgi:hypothetical protein